MGLTYPFHPDTVKLLLSLGYKYLVVDHERLLAHALKEPVSEDTLQFLGLEQFELESMSMSHFLTVQLEGIVVQ